MKANELMIGDWVDFIDPMGDSYKPVKIEEFSKQTLFFNVFGTICPYSLNSTEPIPLTPEILEKNGFEVEKTSIVFRDWKDYKHKEFDFLVQFSWRIWLLCFNANNRR